MCRSHFYERLVGVDKSFSRLPSYHMKAGVSHSEAVDYWYQEIGAKMLNRVAVEAAGESAGPFPLRNLMDLPEGLSDEDVVGVCRAYGDTAIFYANGMAYLAV